MQETRHQFREDLKELERQVLGGLDLVIDQLDRALESVSYQDVELAAMVVADDDRIDGRYLEVHQGILSLLARQAPVAGDLRIVAALLHVIRCIERMGDQCVNIAKLVPLSGYESPKDKDILDAIERMGQLARSQVSQAKEALRHAQRRARPGPGPPGRRDQPAQPRDLQARGGDRRRPRHARVGDVHDPRRALPGADRRQHRRHRRAGGVRGHRPVPRDGRRLGTPAETARSAAERARAPARRPRARGQSSGRELLATRANDGLRRRTVTLCGMSTRPPQIVAFGGGGFSMEWGNPLLDDHVLALTGVACPKVCFLPTASGDADHYVVRFYRAFPASRCEPSHISLFRRETGVGDPRAHLLAQDLIYVGGGSLVSLLGTWRAHGIDLALHEAWRAGVVLCGGSAGSLCWFSHAVSASTRAGPAAGGPRLPAVEQRRALQRRAGPALGVPGRRSPAGWRPATGSATRRRCTSSAPSWPRSSPRAPRPARATCAPTAPAGATSASCRSAIWASRPDGSSTLAHAEPLAA